MSVVRGFGLNGKSFYTNIAKPMSVNLQWTVDATNGLGVTSLKSNGYVNNVFMHTSTTPSANNGFTNPNPANGYAVIQLKQNFNYFIGLQNARLTPPNATATKIDNAALTIGNAYVISTLGDATAAQWLAVGVPAGVTPAVGVPFIALATGAGTANTSTSRVMVPGVSGISTVEALGNPSICTTSAPDPYAGQQIILQFLGATDASTTTLIPKAPAAGSVVRVTLLFDGSSVTIDGI